MVGRMEVRRSASRTARETTTAWAFDLADEPSPRRERSDDLGFKARRILTPAWYSVNAYRNHYNSVRALRILCGRLSQETMPADLTISKNRGARVSLRPSNVRIC